MAILKPYCHYCHHNICPWINSTILFCREPTSSPYWPLSWKTNRSGRNQTCSILSTFLMPTESLWRKTLSCLFQQVSSLFHFLLLQVEILDVNYLYQCFFTTEVWPPHFFMGPFHNPYFTDSSGHSSDEREYSQMPADFFSLWMSFDSQLVFCGYKQEFVGPSLLNVRRFSANYTMV